MIDLRALIDNNSYKNLPTEDKEEETKEEAKLEEEKEELE